MKKRMSKFFALSMILIMTLSIAILSTSCGGTDNLEDYINSNKEVKKQLDDLSAQISTDEMKAEVIIKENTLAYSYTYKETYSKKKTDQMVTFFEESMKSLSTTYETIRDGLEKESKIDGVIVKINFINGDGTEIYTKSFTKKQV